MYIWFKRDRAIERERDVETFNSILYFFQFQNTEVVMR